MAKIPELDALRCYDQKIFVVGNNKTGTTSMQLYFKNLGYNVAVQEEGERIAFSHFFKNDQSLFLEKILEHIEKYDVFQDVPFSFRDFLPMLLEHYPDSKFIYTMRDSFPWFRGLVSFHSRIAGFGYKQQWGLSGRRIKVDIDDVVEKVTSWYYLDKCQSDVMMSVYELESVEQIYDQKKYIAYHESHMAQAKELLAEKQALFIDITKDRAPHLKLAEFMNLPDEFVRRMPHENKGVA